MMMSWRSSGTFREFSRWSSWSSGQMSHAEGSTTFLIGAALSFPNCGTLYNHRDPLSSPQQIKPLPEKCPEKTYHISHFGLNVKVLKFTLHVRFSYLCDSRDSCRSCQCLTIWVVPIGWPPSLSLGSPWHPPRQGVQSWTLEPAHNAGGWHYANRQPFSPDPSEVVNVSVVVWEEFDQLLGTHAVARGQGRVGCPMSQTMPLVPPVEKYQFNRSGFRSLWKLM